MAENEVPDLIDFEIQEESWTDYELADGTLIRMRVCLTFLERMPDREDGFGGRLHTQIQSWSPEEEMDTSQAGPIQPPDDLEDHIKERNVMNSLLREGRSVYLTDEGPITLRITAQHFHKTSLYDPQGNPQYLIQNRVDIQTPAGDLEKAPLDTDTG